MLTNNQEKHEKIVENAAKLLRLHGFQAQKMPLYRCKYDILVNYHIRIEVKVCDKQAISQNGYSYTTWRATLQRNGKLSNNFVDFFWISLLGLPEIKEPTHLIIPSVVIGERKTYGFTIRSMMRKGSKWIDRFDLIRLFEAEGSRSHEGNL